VIRWSPVLPLRGGWDVIGGRCLGEAPEALSVEGSGNGVVAGFAAG
jgi:hypothetical protein